MISSSWLSTSLYHIQQIHHQHDGMQASKWKTCTGDYGTKQFFIIYRVHWQLSLGFTPTVIKWLLHNFALVTTAQLSWHEQNFVMICWSLIELQKKQNSYQIWIVNKNFLVKWTPFWCFNRVNSFNQRYSRSFSTCFQMACRKPFGKWHLTWVRHKDFKQGDSSYRQKGFLLDVFI